ncbi:hypothetical protein ACI1MP_37820 (plasmid) [Kitasatospora griseola]|uniref:hypothetical protein n=1 Tax=Kitasatospora griseola TaxID=2064 RepID=UPI003855A9C6
MPGRRPARLGSPAILSCLVNARLNAESGRGLALVHDLTGGQWGAKLETDGKTVHADYCAPAPPSPRSRAAPHSRPGRAQGTTR